jgi:ankyrin repeat protein
MPEYAALDMPEFLLSRGAKQDIFSLMWMGKYDEAKAFIQTHPEVVNTVGTGMAVPLCYANTVDMAQFLLDHGADIHVRLENNNAGMNSIIEWCAYHWLRYHNDVLKLLIDHAKIEIDPFLLLILGEFDQVRGAIKANSEWIHERTGKDHVLGPGLTLLHLAVQLGPVDVVADLLNMGAAMNATAARHKNMTPLHLAIWRGPKATIEPMPSIAQVLQGQRVIRLLPDIPRLLLERGADIHAKDSEVQRTPLQWAEMPHEDETDRTEVAALLREFGAKA